MIMTAPASFKQADIKRFLEAVQGAGLPISQISFDIQGRIVVQTEHSQAVGKATEWDGLEKILSSPTSSANSRIVTERSA